MQHKVDSEVSRTAILQRISLGNLWHGPLMLTEALWFILAVSGLTVRQCHPLHLQQAG